MIHKLRYCAVSHLTLIHYTHFNSVHVCGIYSMLVFGRIKNFDDWGELPLRDRHAEVLFLTTLFLSTICELPLHLHDGSFSAHGCRRKVMIPGSDRHACALPATLWLPWTTNMCAPQTSLSVHSVYNAGRTQGITNAYCKTDKP